MGKIHSRTYSKFVRQSIDLIGLEINFKCKAAENPNEIQGSEAVEPAMPGMIAANDRVSHRDRSSAAQVKTS
jgi:hypothetical protein